jgi:hypothetical protein
VNLNQDSLGGSKILPLSSPALSTLLSAATLSNGRFLQKGFLVDIGKVVAELKLERVRIEQAISALEGLASPTAPRRGRPPKGASTRGQRGHHMSAAARKRISQAMKQRWAKWKGKSAPKKTKARPAMSAAAKKKLSALMKARWAARKKANG